MIDGMSTALASLNLPLFTWLSVIIDQYIYVILLGAAIAAYLGYASVRRNRLKLAAFAISLLVMTLLVFAVKAAAQQPRPCEETQEYLKLPNCPSDGSFPSGHAAFAFTFAAASLGTAFFPPFLIVAIITALSRVYLGVHTLNDVVAGLVIGLATYFIIEGWLRRLVPQIVPEKERRQEAHWRKEEAHVGLAFEARRQTIHVLAGFAIILLLYLLGKPETELLLMLGLFVGMSAMHLRMEGKWMVLTDRLFDVLERPRVMPAKGAFMYILGALLLLSTLQEPAKAMAALGVLALGDGAATLFGKAVGGRMGLPYNRQKSWAGALAFFVAGAAGAFPFIGLAAIPLAFVCAAVETLDLGIDDNLLVPLAALAFFLL